MVPKYKTERQLKKRVFELAQQNKTLLDMLSFNVQDIGKGVEDGLTKEQCKDIIERTLETVNEYSNKKS